MKRYFYVLISLIFIFSCKSNTDQNDQDSVAVNSRPLNETPDLIQQFKPVIQGVWVKKDYIKKLIRRKSPLDAMPLATGITTFYIDTDKLKGDSIIVPVGWGNHEGGSLSLKFVSGKEMPSIMLGDNELSYTIKNNDTTLIINHYDAKTQETITEKYTKALNKQPDDELGYGLNNMINGIICGTYAVTDNTGRQFNVVFGNNGKVSGFGGVDSFFIANDLGMEPMSNLDEIAFLSNGKAQKSYTFTIKGRKLNLYETKPNADSTKLIAGRLAYALRRIR
ncbi:hypothetical protein [Mucilaginibacter segetis]|uniref:Lipoprotein n=1 Tax=Mucilaginibacter segetis TaxID=2793071 RepID=A0A934PQA2_9SPHI|nr:hypothetical protein [Mucilaginibacter segetis]MBK0377701.1 hypothetical protein [Mucilaginibacter segetis]